MRQHDHDSAPTSSEKSSRSFSGSPQQTTVTRQNDHTLNYKSSTTLERSNQATAAKADLEVLQRRGLLRQCSGGNLAHERPHYCGMMEVEAPRGHCDAVMRAAPHLLPPQTEMRNRNALLGCQSEDGLGWGVIEVTAELKAAALLNAQCKSDSELKAHGKGRMT